MSRIIWRTKCLSTLNNRTNLHRRKGVSQRAMSSVSQAKARHH